MDRLDVEVHDAQLQDEIRLVTDLMVAANESDGPLCREAIDAVLAGRSGLINANGQSQPPNGPSHDEPSSLQDFRARPDFVVCPGIQG